MTVPSLVTDQDEGDNLIMLQGFEWYLPSGGTHWKVLKALLPTLKALGIDNCWIPPGCKSGWQGSNGYDTYDLYDLGEFDQKGSYATKFGSKEDLVEMTKAAKANGVGVLWDAVLNHKCSADFTERFQAIKVDHEDRRKEIGNPHEIEAWTGYDFAGRSGKYSSMKYRWQHFSSCDWEASLKTNEFIYKFIGANKNGFAEDVDTSLGNYDFLMGNDLDYSQSEVRDDIIHWGQWIVKEVGLSGFRLDAVKHFSHGFLKQWIKYLDSQYPGKLFFVGEYWRPELEVLGPMIEKFNGRLSLFDVELAGKFSEISMSSGSDLRDLLTNTLAKHHPQQAVTFVQNHDTQPRHERDHHVVPIQPWFIPHSYAFILFHASSIHPCIFWGDLFGLYRPNHPVPGQKENSTTANGSTAPNGRHPKPHSDPSTSITAILPKMMVARKFYAYGPSTEYFDSPQCIGFTRHGLQTKSSGAGCAVLLNTADTFAVKRMYVGVQHADETWTDILGFAWSRVPIDADGFGVFPVGPKAAGVGVWTRHDASGRNVIDGLHKLELPDYVE